MSETPVRVAVIVGSVREGRFGPVVAGWLAGVADRHGGFEVDVVDLAEPALPLVMPAFGTEPGPAVAAEAAKWLRGSKPPTPSSWSRRSTTTAIPRR